MRSEDILDAIGEIDDHIILSAREKPKSKRRFIYSAAAIAACFILVLGAVFNPAFRPAHSSDEHAMEGDEPEKGEVLDGNNGSAEGTPPITNDDLHGSITQGSIAHNPIPEPSEEEKAFVIFYVKNGVTEKEECITESSPNSIFERWKEKNGIGDEVQLIDVSAYTKPSTETYYSGGECIIEHTTDAITCLNIVLSASIADYYDIIDSADLLMSLEKTIKGYTGRDFDECTITLK
ncbi:MAG: hypothetical protein IJ499_03705 [Clostridia bacterium]|nr:hypothetical protein [Clostridia bacterium]